MVEAEVVDFIDDYDNDENEGTFEITPSKKSWGGIGREEKGGDLNETLEKTIKGINSKS